MSDRPSLVAFIDESGQRAMTAASSDHFILAAVAMPESYLPRAAKWLADLRKDLGRGPNDVLHWLKYPSHSHRLRASQELGRQGFARVSAVVCCKRHLPKPRDFTADHAYMFAFRMLLERLSWLAQEREMDLSYTLGHVKGFSKTTLREYEGRLRAMSPSICKIKWEHIVGNGAIERPETEEMLQISDVAASAIGAAFNPDPFGNTERRYLANIAPRFYRGPDDGGRLTSYGLKMHPWKDNTRAAYPWVAAL